MWVKTFRVFWGLLTSLYSSQIPIIACLAITFLDFNIFLSKFLCSFLSSTFQIVEGLMSTWIFSSYKQTFSCHRNALIFFLIQNSRSYFQIRHFSWVLSPPHQEIFFHYFFGNYFSCSCSVFSHIYLWLLMVSSMSFIFLISIFISLILLF